MQAILESGSLNRNKLLISGVVGVAAVALGYYTLFGNKLNENGDEAPALTEEEALKVMNLICDKFQLVAAQMSQYAQGVKQQYQQQGMMVDESELMQALLPQVDKGLQESEQAAYEVRMRLVEL